MTQPPIEPIFSESSQILENWLDSCRRNKQLSRNTIAIGIVVLDHLRQKGIVQRAEVISSGGEVKGARSTLGNILERYAIPSTYLKEVTTRQGHQDGQRLFEQFDWGAKFAELPEAERENILNSLIEKLTTLAHLWLERQNLKLSLDRRQSPAVWIGQIIENTKGRSGGVVEQHLVGAKLERRFKNLKIANFPAHAGDQQTERRGDFVVGQLIYHVTASPSRNVMQKCAANIRTGHHPILVIPREQENRARIYAQDEGIEKELTILSLESFLTLSIVEIAAEEGIPLYNVMADIIEIYNKRLIEVETDLSLLIELL